MLRSQTFLALMILVVGATATGCMRDRMPGDFEIKASAGGIPDWNGTTEHVHLYANGRGEWARWENGVFSPADSGRFVVPPERVAEVLRAIRSNHFFRLAPRHVDRRIFDGGYLRLWVVAYGDTHVVRVRNANVPRMRRIYEAINRRTPREATLGYADIGQQSSPWWMRLLR